MLNRAFSVEPARTSYVNTVRGPVEVSQLGPVLMHEHIFCRTRSEDLPVAKEFLVAQLKRVAQRGVRTVVDLTTYVLPDDYLDVAAAVPEVNIICCAGYYTKHRIPAAYRNLSVGDLTERLRQKVCEGIGRKRVLPGIIKVATSGHNFTRLEKAVLRAAATVQREQNIPIATHACRGGRKQLEELVSGGANPKKIFLSHMEMELKGNRARPYTDIANDMLWILRQGAYIFFGDFTAGETSYRRDLLRLLRFCCDKGFANQVFLSTDSYWSCRRGKMRVRGSSVESRIPRTYEYVFTLIKPVLRENGFSDIEFKNILQRNPMDFFSQQSSPRMNSGHEAEQLLLLT